jgi:hypothetical protein
MMVDDPGVPVKDGNIDITRKKTRYSPDSTLFLQIL